jgi:hypothetical protein
MLEGLDKIDWKKYGHAYGEAHDVPAMLRALTRLGADADDDEISEAIQPLFSTIWHQGTVYSATAIAVPFLIELLATAPNRLKSGILHLLHCCGTGHGYYEVHGRLDAYRDRREIPEFQAIIKEELKAVYAAHDAVVAGLDIYIPYLNSEDSEVREMAAMVISICDVEADKAAEALKACILNEKTLPASESRLKVILQWLGRLISRDGLRREVLKFSANDNLLFSEWLIADDFPGDAKAVVAQFLLNCGDEERRKLALDFIQAIPDNASIILGSSVYNIVSALENFDLKLTIDWIERMARHPDVTALRYLPSILASLYREYRIEAAPIFEILLTLLEHNDSNVRGNTMMSLPAFPSFIEKTKIILEQAIEKDKQNPKQDRIIQQTINDLNHVKGRKSLVKTIPQWLGIPKPLAFSLDELIDELEKTLEKNPAYQNPASNLLANLAPLGQSILVNERSLDLLKKAIAQNDQWTRIRALRILAEIAPKETQDILIPALIAEIRGRPVGLIAIDTLGLLAKAGIDIRAALPRLEILAHAFKRQIEGAAIDTKVLEDEQLQALALNVLSLIKKES